MEIMVAGVLATFISLAIFQVIVQGVRMSDTMITKVVINTFAREAFWLLATGGVAELDPATGFEVVSGFHGRRDIPVLNNTGATGDLFSDPSPAAFSFFNTLRLSVSQADAVTTTELARFVRTTSTRFVNVVCADEGVFSASCPSGAIITDARIGYVRKITVDDAVVIPDETGTNRIHDIRLSIADPRRMNLFANPSPLFTESQYIEEFRTSLSTRADISIVPTEISLNGP
jgi:hypothetical protein